MYKESKAKEDKKLELAGSRNEIEASKTRTQGRIGLGE